MYFNINNKKNYIKQKTIERYIIMKISQIQSYQSLEMKSNMGVKNQNCTTPTFKGATSNPRCLPCVVGHIGKWGAIWGGIFLGLLSLKSYVARNNIDSYLKARIYAEAVAPTSQEGSHITEQEMEDYNNAIAFYQQIKDENNTNFTILEDPNDNKLRLLSDWMKCYTKLESEEGMKLTVKEKEQIRFAIDNNITPMNTLYNNQLFNDNDNDAYRRQLLMQQSATRHLLNNK